MAYCIVMRKGKCIDSVSKKVVLNKWRDSEDLRGRNKSGEEKMKHKFSLLSKYQSREKERIIHVKIKQCGIFKMKLL